jgi:hypothetical protein
MSNQAIDTTPELPAFFSTIKLPSVAKWAMDKVKFVNEGTLVCEGRETTVQSWYFSGRMPRFHKHWQQYDSPETGEQFLLIVSSHGGEYRGTKPLIQIRFSRFASVDGRPLPV